MNKKIDFKSVIYDQGRRKVAYNYNNTRNKRILDKNTRFDSDKEQVLFLNRLVDAIQSKDDINALKKLSNTNYFKDFKEEIALISKILDYEEDEKKNSEKDKYILLGDIRSGKSYIVANIIAEILNIDKEIIIDILSGMGETTVSNFKFNFRNSEEENFNISYSAISDSELNDIAEEIVEKTFERIKEKENKKKEIKGCIPKQVALNTFRLKQIITDKIYKKIDSELIEFYMKNNSISKDKFIESQKNKVLEIITVLRNEIRDKLTLYKNKEFIAIEDFIEILRYVTSKNVASFLKNIDFVIFRPIKKDFELMDSIGLNHGEGTGVDNGLLRETRLINIIDKYPDYKFIYVINSMNTTSATLAPIEFMEKIGILNDAIIVVSHLDMNKNIDFNTFKEEKINDRIDDDIYELMNKRMLEGPIVLYDIFEAFENIEYKNKIDIVPDKNLKGVCKNAASLFKDWISNYLNGINWKKMDSILDKERFCIDEHFVGGTLHFSVSKYLVTYIIKNISNEQLLWTLGLDSDTSKVEFNDKRKVFVKNLLSVFKLYLINYNVDQINKLYLLRWNDDLRIYTNISMTKERAKRFEEIIVKNIDEEIISTFINLSVE